MRRGAERARDFGLGLLIGAVVVALAWTPASAAPASVAADCGFAPLLAPSSAADHQFTLGAALAIDKTGEPGPYLDVARQAAGAGRMRDAEVALIVACRLAARQPGGPTVALADVQERLADHYASAAIVEEARATRARIWARARSLYGASLQTHMAVLGGQPSSMRTAQARPDGLAQDRATLVREASEIAASEPPRTIAARP